MPLPAARLADMRTRANHYLVDTCVIEYPTQTSDGMGGWTDSWTTRGTVDCYKSSREANEVGVTGDVLKTFTEHTLYIASGGTLVQGDRVTLGSEVYLVEGVVTGSSRRGYLQGKLTRTG